MKQKPFRGATSVKIVRSQSNNLEMSSQEKSFPPTLHTIWSSVHVIGSSIAFRRDNT